jgi:hypothetical protein
MPGTGSAIPRLSPTTPSVRYDGGRRASRRPVGVGASRLPAHRVAGPPTGGRGGARTLPAHRPKAPRRWASLVRRDRRAPRALRAHPPTPAASRRRGRGFLRGIVRLPFASARKEPRRYAPFDRPSVASVPLPGPRARTFVGPPRGPEERVGRSAAAVASVGPQDRRQEGAAARPGGGARHGGPLRVRCSARGPCDHPGVPVARRPIPLRVGRHRRSRPGRRAVQCTSTMVHVEGLDPAPVPGPRPLRLSFPPPIHGLTSERVGDPFERGRAPPARYRASDSGVSRSSVCSRSRRCPIFFAFVSR